MPVALPRCMVMRDWEFNGVKINGRTPIEIITSETPDISEYIDFFFYNWVTFRSEAGFDQPRIGRCLGVSYKIGQAMSYWILPDV